MRDILTAAAVSVAVISGFLASARCGATRSTGQGGAVRRRSARRRRSGCRRSSCWLASPEMPTGADELVGVFHVAPIIHALRGRRATRNKVRMNGMLNRTKGNEQEENA